MTCEDIARVLWHLDTPVCRTLGGTKVHLRLVSFKELRLLVRYFNCSAEDLVERFWCCRKTAWPTPRDCRNCNGRAGGCRMDGLCETPSAEELAMYNEVLSA
ncbi:MAG: hypothetical protein KAY65_12880 [Planctomycetes bacterium]|nr:hypothetical protein [Planctomycetota bacterium]